MEQTKKKAIIDAVFSQMTFEEFLCAALEEEKITSSDIVSAADIYEAPKEEELSDKESILEKVKAAFDEVTDKHYIGDENISFSEFAKIYLPSFEELLDTFRSNYDEDDMLEAFDNDDLLNHLDGSIELEWHDDKVAKKAQKENIEEYYAIYNEILEEAESMELEDKDGDSLWRMMCNAGNGGYYDIEAKERGLKKLLEKLEKSSYNQLLKRQ